MFIEEYQMIVEEYQMIVEEYHLIVKSSIVKKIERCFLRSSVVF